MSKIILQSNLLAAKCAHVLINIGVLRSAGNHKGGSAATRHASQSSEASSFMEGSKVRGGAGQEEGGPHDTQ